jgi:hypothetical protein
LKSEGTVPLNLVLGSRKKYFLVEWVTTKEPHSEARGTLLHVPHGLKLTNSQFWTPGAFYMYEYVNSVHCAVKTGSLSIIQVKLRL